MYNMWKDRDLLMQGRNIEADKDGNEWMNVAQYTRAIFMDFDTKLSQTLISLYRKKERFNSIYLQKKAGKNCINYTQTVIDFLSSHPAICPENFEKVANDWKKKLKPTAKKTIGKVKAVTKEDPDDDYAATSSVAIEKAKHEKIKRQKAEFEFDIMQGNYMHLDDLVPLLQTIAIETRQAVKALIPRATPILAAINDIHETKKILDEETDTALNHIERIPQIIDGTYQEQVAEQQQKEIESET